MSYAQNGTKFESLPADLRPSNPEVIKLLKDASDATDVDSAVPFLRQAVDYAAKAGLISDLAIAEVALSQAEFILGKWKSAEEIGESALAHSRESGKLSLEAEMLVSLSSYPRARGDIEAAKRLLVKAVDIADQSKNFYIRSRALGELSTFQLELGEKAESEKNLGRALELDEINDLDIRPLHLIYLADLQASKRDFQAASVLATLQTASELAAQKKLAMPFVMAQTKIAVLNARIGNYETAFSLLEQIRGGTLKSPSESQIESSKLTSAAKLPLIRILVLVTLGQAYVQNQQEGKAEGVWKELYELAAKAGPREVEAGSAEELGALFANRKDFDSASQWFERARTAYRSAGLTEKLGLLLGKYSSILMQARNFPQAADVLKEQSEVAVKMNNSYWMFNSQLNLARALFQTGEVNEAARLVADCGKFVYQLRADDHLDQKVLTKELFYYYYFAGMVSNKQGDVLREALSWEAALNTGIEQEELGEGAKEVYSQASRFMSDDLAKKEALTARDQGRLSDALLWDALIEDWAVFQTLAKQNSASLTENYNNAVSSSVELLTRISAAQDGSRQLSELSIRLQGLTYGPRQRVLQLLLDRQLREGSNQEAYSTGLQLYTLIKSKSAHEPLDPYGACRFSYAAFLNKKTEESSEALARCKSLVSEFKNEELMRYSAALETIVEGNRNPAQARIAAQKLLEMNPQQPSAWSGLALLDMSLGRKDDAIKEWDKALQLLGDAHNVLGLAELHMQVGENLVRDESVTLRTLAATHFSKALELYVTLHNIEGEVRSRIQLGRYEVQKKQSSRKQLGTALEVARKGGNKTLIAQALGAWAFGCDSWGDTSAALTAHKEAAELYEGVKDYSNQSFELLMAGSNLETLRQHNESLEFFQKAKSVADKADAWVSRYWSRWNLASSYETDGAYDVEIETLLEAQERNEMAVALRLSQPYSITGRWEEALNSARKALSIAKELADSKSEFYALVELLYVHGDRRSDIQDFAKAEEYYRQALDLASKNSELDTVDISADITEVYWQQGRVQDALTEIKKYLQRSIQNKSQSGELNSRITLIELFRLSGDLAKASEEVVRVEALIKNETDFYTWGRFNYVKAGLLHAQHRDVEALSIYKHLLSILDKLGTQGGAQEARKVSNAYSFIYEEMLDVIFTLSQAGNTELGNAETALQVAEKNKSVEFSQRWGRVFLQELRAQLPAELQEQERKGTADQANAAKEYASALAGTSSGSVQEAKKRVEEAESKLSEIADDLRTKHPNYASLRFPKPPRVADIPLRERETLVEFKVTESGVYVWVLRRTSETVKLIRFYRVNRTRRWVNERVTAIRDAFNRADLDQIPWAAIGDLYSSLFPESEQDVIVKSEALVIIPDESLFLVPIEILTPSGQFGSFPLASKPISYYPSLSSLVFSRAANIGSKQTWSKSFLGIGDPITDQSVSDSDSKRRALLTSRGFKFERIPETATEIRNIAGLFTAKGQTDFEVRLGVDATKAKFLSTDLSRFRYIHLATHGILPMDSGPVEPSLVFSNPSSTNGSDQLFLSTSEILHLNNTADMVVLSACNTGSGKVSRAEGVMNLGRAFMMSGASSAAVSLWQVSDTSTAILMKEFYKNLLQGESKRDALAHARSSLRSQGYDNPFFWGAFVLIGE